MYTYPIDYEEFTQDEIIALVEFLSMIENINEGQKVDRKKLAKQYQQYRNIINSVSIEKQIEREFKSLSGYSIYQTIKQNNPE
jgi:uncharacterized protein YktA (UPF0223 family)